MAAIGKVTLDEIWIVEVDADPSVSGVAAPTGSLALLNGALGFWQKFDTGNTDWVHYEPASDLPAYKSGKVVQTSFSGNPKTATVAFTTAFSSANYSVHITGSDGRFWIATNLAAAGFIINAQANQALTGPVYWSAILNGESV